MGKRSDKQVQSAARVDHSDHDTVNDTESARQSDEAISDAQIDGNALPLPEVINHLPPQTCCPSCQTVFEVADELLASSDTRVRCGECLRIFDALVNLRHHTIADADGSGTYHDAFEDTGPGPAVPSPEQYPGLGTPESAGIPSVSGQVSVEELSELDVTYSDFDLFSGEFELPEVAYFDDTQDTGMLRFSDAETDETFNDTLFSHDLTIEPLDISPPGIRPPPGLNREAAVADVGFITDDVKREPVRFTYREQNDGYPEPDLLATADATDETIGHHPADVDSSAPVLSPSLHQPGKKPRKWMARTLLVSCLLAVIGGLYGYRNQAALLQNPELRPWLVRACELAGCEIPALTDLAALKILKRSMFSHPTRENSLVLDLAFVNQADFDQPYPVLEIRWTERSGRLVRQNAVTPAAYLRDWQAGDMLAAGERLDLSLTVEDPGENATDFVLTFK